MDYVAAQAKFRRLKRRRHNSSSKQPAERRRSNFRQRNLWSRSRSSYARDKGYSFQAPVISGNKSRSKSARSLKLCKTDDLDEINIGQWQEDEVEDSEYSD